MLLILSFGKECYQEDEQNIGIKLRPLLIFIFLFISDEVKFKYQDASEIRMF